MAEVTETQERKTEDRGKIKLKDLEPQILQDVFKGWNIEPSPDVEEKGWHLHTTLEDGTRLNFYVNLLRKEVSLMEFKADSSYASNRLSFRGVTEVEFDRWDGQMTFHNKKGEDYLIRSGGRDHVISSNDPSSEPRIFTEVEWPKPGSPQYPKP